MYIIVNTNDMSIFHEPSRPSWRSATYKTLGAAKAALTRTFKCFAKDKKSDYPRYNEYYFERNPGFEDGSAFKIMNEDEYVEPQVTDTGICPGSGKEMSYTHGINEPYYLSPLSESYWSR